MNEYVFISYKSEQKHIALKVRNILEENNTPESIPGGSDYAAEITRAIRQCKELIVILSSLSQDSVHVRKEIDSAIKRNKTVLPFVIDEFSFNDSIDYYFTNVQLYTAYLSWESAIEKLIREVRYAFDSIDVQRTSQTILNDPVKIASALPHTFDEGYLLFGRYEIKKLLGVYCGNQQHYEGTDSHTQKRVLIKYIDRTLPYKETGLGISDIGALLQHPYIASAIDEYSNESYFIHIEPFYEVRSLSYIIAKHGPQSEADVLKWSKAICQAMIYLNEDMGYAYCCMTPQNIRIQKNGIPILFDMDTAPTLNSTIATILDPNHFPIEAFFNDCVVKPTIDIYSLGSNMFYALTGKPYVVNYSAKEYDSFSNDKNISYGLKAIIHKCLQTNPEDRYQSFRDVLYDLENTENIKATKKNDNFFNKLFNRKKQ